MPNNKKERGKQNKKKKDAMKLLDDYNKEMDRLKHCEDYDRLPKVSYNKEGGFFVLE